MEPMVGTNAVPANQPRTVRDAAATGENGTLVSADFETFLRLLTTQLENQDPLNPMESSQFAVQLATFSGVEQQVRTNDLLADLVGGSQATGLSDLAGWVGKEARAPLHVDFNGTAVELVPPAIAAADRALLVIHDSTGAEVGRIDIPNDGAPFTWLGTGTGGAPLDPGTYGFTVEGFAGGERVGSVPTETSGLVAEVRAGADGPTLVLEDGTRIAVADVTAVRNPANGI